MMLVRKNLILQSCAIESLELIPMIPKYLYHYILEIYLPFSHTPILLFFKWLSTYYFSFSYIIKKKSAFGGDLRNIYKIESIEYFNHT